MLLLPPLEVSEELSVMGMELLRSPQASIHWSARPVCSENPGRATVLGKADLARNILLRQVQLGCCRVECNDLVVVVNS